MAVSSQDILNFLLANPNMSDRDIAAAMDMYGVTPAMMAQAVGIPVEQVQQRYEDVKPQGLLTPPVKAPEPVYTPEPVKPSEPTYVAPTYSEPTYQEPTQPEPQQTQEAQTMAITSKQIVDFLLANPNMSDAQIVSAMDTYKISPAQMAEAVGLSESQVVSRIVPVLAQDVAQNGLYTQTIANNETGQTEITQRTLPLGFNAYQDESGQLSYSRVDPTKPDKIQLYGSQGEYRGEEKITTTTQDLIRNLGPIALAAGGTALAQGLLGGAATGATGTGLEFAGSGGAFDLANAGIAGGTSSFTAAELAAIQAAQTAGTAAGTAGLLTPAVTSAVAPSVAGTTAATTAASTIPAATAATTAASALTPTAASVLAPAAVSALNPTVANIATSLIPTAVKSLFTPTNVGNLLQTGAQTAAGLLQQQTSKEAADKARAMIEAETAAAKQSAAFRPVGMTTRFGTSQFQIDPTTGQLTSAGYTLSPEAKNAQDRLVKLAESGLQQAEGAQAQYAPLQTGAQSLFGLGNQYLAQSPQDVAQNYLNQQMALLQPGRELELANLQNRLQQQGRGGLSVAQGGSYGATTPELQALYNARAMQEAQLAAQAQQAGQQQVAFGAGLLGTGAQTMGQYYGGQQAAYAPYTTALGQVQGLETAAQQPLTMGAALGQQASTAGFNVGRLGLQGAGQSVALATGADATRNPYASALSGAAANPVFGQVLGGLFNNIPPVTAMSALPTSFGTGSYYGQQDLGLYL